MSTHAPPFRHPSAHAPRNVARRLSCMRILLVTMVPGLLALAVTLTACGSPFLGEIGPADAELDAGDPAEAATHDHHLGVRHEAGADHDGREAGRDHHVAEGGVPDVAPAPDVDPVDAGSDVVVELDAQTDVSQPDVIAPPPSDAGDEPDAVTPPVDAGLDVAPEAAPDVAPPLDSGTDGDVADVAPPPVDAGLDQSSPDVGAPDVLVDAGAPDVVPDVVTDTGPVDTGVDSACITPFSYPCSGGGLVASAPYQACVYDEYFVAYSLGSVPYACQCAATFTCACLSYYPSVVCGGRSWSFCTESGGGPQVTCD